MKMLLFYFKQAMKAQEENVSIFICRFCGWEGFLKLFLAALQQAHTKPWALFKSWGRDSPVKQPHAHRLFFGFSGAKSACCTERRELRTSFCLWTPFNLSVADGLKICTHSKRWVLTPAQCLVQKIHACFCRRRGASMPAMFPLVCTNTGIDGLELAGC